MALSGVRIWLEEPYARIYKGLARLADLEVRSVLSFEKNLPEDCQKVNEIKYASVREFYARICQGFDDFELCLNPVP